jgi:hypothetical protein
MKLVMSLVAGLLFACWSAPAQAQVPYIVGTWELNVEASRFPGQPPRTEVRRYILTDDGVLIGIAVFVGSQGNPGFLQFAAKPDGMDYPEFDTRSAGQHLIDGTPPPRTYAEIPTDDPRRVQWVDKQDGRIVGSGEKWVSEDGQTLTITSSTRNAQGEEVVYTYVYDRTGS